MKRLRRVTITLLAGCALLFSGCNKQKAEVATKRTVERSSREVNGMKVALVTVSGTYLAPGGPMMQSQGKKENYRLLGAIVEGPEGSVFFKFTGPTQTVVSAQGSFDALISSLAKGSGAASVAGINWSLPAGWSEQPPRQMRVATYAVPAASGDAEGGECAVFYFGNDQGGGVEANIDRWITQFEEASTTPK
jgi:hypothetical protein